jgi:hypothetical protein
VSSSQIIRDDEAIQTAAKSLFLGCAPERSADLDQLWRDYSPKFQLTDDLNEGRHVIMEAGAYRFVRFNHRVLRAFWLASYAAWEGYTAAHRTLTQNTPIDLKRFSSLLTAYYGVLSSDRPDLELLPPGVAEPGEYVDRNRDAESRAAAELATFAVGWTLLHEVHHLQRQQDGTSADPHEAGPTRRREEELCCDLYATRFLLQDVAKYAATESVAPELVHFKRQLGIYFALFGLTLLAKNNWGDTSTHPAVQTRIDAVHRATEPRSEVAYAIAHVAFASLRALWPSVPGPF